MRLLAVDGRVDVLAAGDQQPVQAVENPVGDVGVDRLRRQQHRHPAGRGDALKVDGRKETGGHVPDSGLRLIRDRWSVRSPAAGVLDRPDQKPLKPTNPLPIGDRRVERGHLDAGVVDVVVDHVVTERLPGDR